MGVALDARTDDDLLTLLRAGDEVAFGELVDRHRPWLVRLCTRLLGHDAHAAEDAAQESLLKLHAAARQGRPLRVRPWLTVVARNTCVDEQRRRRPDLPGEIPERAVQGNDPGVDAALTDAWARLSGRHREVLYLREVLGFSYKEIGALLGLSMPATETLLFRARAALRREYERSGGASFGCLVLGLQLARIGRRQRDAGAREGLSGIAVHDAGFSGLANRVSQFLSTSLPGCSEQALAKVLSVAAGVTMAAASMTAGIGPFGETPAAAGAPPGVSATGDLGGGDLGGGELPVAATPALGGRLGPAEGPPAGSWKTLLGDAVPEGWVPERSPAAATTARTAGSVPAEPEALERRRTPLRDAVEVARAADRPQWRPEREEPKPGPLRSILAARPERRAEPDRPRPIRTFLADPIPLALDALPFERPPIELVPGRSEADGPLTAEAVPAEPADPLPAPAPAPAPEDRPAMRETADSPLATFAGDERTPLRLRDR